MCVNPEVMMKLGVGQLSPAIALGTAKDELLKVLEVAFIGPFPILWRKQSGVEGNGESAYRARYSSKIFIVLFF